MKIDLVKLVEEVYKLEGEPKNVNKVFALICLQAFKEQLTLTDVVEPKGTCCLKPKKIGKVNDMFESWDECKNCGKEVL